jgi:hypothetical protein
MAYFLRTRAGDDPVSCLWAFDCATAQERLLADPVRLLAGAAEELPPEERARRERAREQSAGIVAYAADNAGELLVFVPRLPRSAGSRQRSQWSIRARIPRGGASPTSAGAPCG